MSGNTDIGLVRQINEDSYRLLPEHDALVVCDGMGGHAAGEVASQRAADTVIAFLQRDPEKMETTLAPLNANSLPAEAEALAQAVRLANRNVYDTAQEQKGMRGMGTTLVTCRFWDNRVAICHVGDSRAYRFARGKLEPLTIDHSLLAELKAQGEITPDQEKNFPERNVITRALGTRPSVAVDVKVEAIRQNDWYVLCSDGLCGYLEDPEIERVLIDTYPDYDAAIQQLIEMANGTGGHDNCTVAIAVVAEVNDDSDVNEVLATIPESSQEEADLESAVLTELGFGQRQAPRRASDVDTDRIKVVPSPPGEDGPQDSVDEKTQPPVSKKRKGGFWPWS
jgi:protein phosphatase